MIETVGTLAQGQGTEEEERVTNLTAMVDCSRLFPFRASGM